MNGPNIAVFSGEALGPSTISANLAATRQAGWTTIILGLFHVGQSPDAIYFNNTLLIVDGRVEADLPTWQGLLKLLRQGGTITNVYASFGGGSPVRDFTAIREIYNANNYSFRGTMLETNLTKLREALPAINGIDMDAEDMYDQPSFLAFCQMVRGLGWDITFCPAASRDGPDPKTFWFWINSLKAIQQSSWGRDAVKWFNLQMYADVSRIPVWVQEIRNAIPGFSTDQFIVAGCWARFWTGSSWDWWCPSLVQEGIAYYNKDGRPSLSGGFIWNMDYVLQTTSDPAGCGGLATMADYTKAIRDGMQV